jgi:hypothetical protein
VTTIRASCPSCGDVDLTVRDVSVRVCANDHSGSYHFRCPACEMAVAKHAEPNVVELLVSSGVTMAVWQLPAELWEPRVGEPISHDDLLDFHAILAEENWFDRLASLVDTDQS